MYRILAGDSGFEESVKAIVSRNFPAAKHGLTTFSTIERDAYRNAGAGRFETIQERFDESSKNYFLWGTSRMGGAHAVR